MNNCKLRMLRLCIMIVILVFVIHISQKFTIFQNDASKDLYFSVQSGFYDESFILEIFGGGEDSEIYYTLDCKDPDIDSKKYTEPIEIMDASLNNNNFCNITDVYLGFNSMLQDMGLVKYMIPYQIPSRKVDKATIVKAVAIDRNGNRSKILTGVYFVGKRFRDRNVNVVSVVTDPDNLFNYYQGIYVTGNTFDSYFSELKSYDGFKSYHVPANYRNRGEEWHKDAIIWWWNSELKISFEEECRIGIQGNMSRTMLPKSLNIFESQNNKEKGLDTETTSSTLYNCSTDLAWVLDPLINLVSSELNIATKEYIPYELYLDGEYWGVLHLTERFDNYYFQNRFGVMEDNVIYIKHHNSVEVGKPSDIDLYNELLELIEAIDMKEDNSYKIIDSVLDIESALDYYAVETYICNWDWPENNYGIWRTRNNEQSTYGDTRWRFVLFDVNSSFDETKISTDSIVYACWKDRLFARLMDNDRFKTQFYDRLHFLSEYVFNPEKLETVIDNYKYSNYEIALRNRIRFFDDDDMKWYDDTFDAYKEFLRKRYDYFNK